MDKPGYGANWKPGSGVLFRVWAPWLEKLWVESELGTVQLERNKAGEHEGCLKDARPGHDYWFRDNKGTLRPDPASRWQPQGVHRPSRIFDSRSHNWQDRAWTGRPLEEYVLYELHVGTFSSKGDFAGVADRIGELRELGVTAIELMPVAEFPGSRNWGYDGVFPFAPHSSYGGPGELQYLVDSAHGQGMAVVLDVVYNHLGPEGNYLGAYAPYFTKAYSTPWGDAVNFDGPDSDPVRRFFIENALYWLREFHIDGLRLDAVHGIYDCGARHFLDELSEAFQDEARRLGRRAWLIAESNRNDVRLIRPRTAGGYGLDAQWNDDFHHSLITLLTGRRDAYLGDFGSLADLSRAIADGFVYDGRYSVFRRRRHGSSSQDRPGCQFVVYAQNHDQVANTFHGRRLNSVISFDQQKLAVILLLCSPCLPLLFMGQEYGETSRFDYFTSHEDPQLAEAVRQGRRREFEALDSAGEWRDPQALETFEGSRLSWDWTAPRRAAIRRLHRDLLRLRRHWAPLGNCRKDLTCVQVDEDRCRLTMRREDEQGGRALLIANLGSSPCEWPGAEWECVLESGSARYAGQSRRPDQLPGYQAALFRWATKNNRRNGNSTLPSGRRG